MSQSHRGQFGPGSLLALLALAAGSAVAEPLPPLRVNPALLGAGTPPVPAIVEPTAIAKPVAPAPRVVEAPPTARGDLTAEQPRAATAPVPRPAPSPGSPSAKPATPAAASATASSASPAQPTAPAATPQLTTVEAIQKPQEPPQVAERTLPPLYSAHVAAGELPAPELKPASGVMPWLKQPGEALPTFVAADRIAGQTDVELVAEGSVELRKRNSSLQSDRLTYRQPIEEIEAEGNVRLSRDGDRVQGPRMRMQMEESTGFFEQPEYSIRRIRTGSAPTLWTGTEERRSANPSTAIIKTGAIWTGDEEPEATGLTTGHGSATRMDFEGEGRYRLTDATYSTCTPVAGRDPDWFVRTADLRLDYDAEEGSARDATLVFLGTPILYSPWLNFSLNNERKSGLLTPTAGSTSKSGIEFTQPFYWNIAPNMDATVAPRYMEKRGMLWNGEYRYLQSSYSGTINGQYLNEDKLENDIRRSSYSVKHRQNFGYGLYGTLDLNGVSDDTFFSDLGSGTAVVSRTNLLRQGTLSYSGGWWSANLLAQRYQTLQDPDLPPVTEPYRRLPQVTVTASRGDLPHGMTFGFKGEYVDFRSGNSTTTEGKRVVMYPQLSLPLQTDILSITPKLGLHSTRYDLDTRYDVNGAVIGGPDTITRNVPLFSVDSGVVFERDFAWQGKSLIQTLEPRLYYLYVPNRNQDRIPVFDTSTTDYNFAQTFAENRYGGPDRIGDANQLTAMVSTRLLNPETGAETLRASLGQRFYFTDQKVGLPATPTSPAEVLRTERYADLLGSFSGQILEKTYADANLQYSPQVRRMERFNVGGRYQPEAGKVLNAGYRYTRDQLQQPGLSQIDVSGQWPLAGGWHGVGRINYSVKESRMVETVAGLEYDGGCWIGRVVFQRLATQERDSNTSFFVQLEFNGFAKVGTNPLEMLKRNVPGYGVINQQTSESPFDTP
jgi:LPS-assembly protein